MQLLKGELTELRAYKTANDEWRLEVLGAPFGGHLNNRDAHKEYFTPRTDFMVKVGDTRPVIYYHGRKAWGKPEARPQAIGVGTVTRIDDEGVWFDVVLDQTKADAQRIWANAIKGIVKASTGAVAHLVRKVKATGEILTWAIGELTLVDQGQGRIVANQLATANLKALYEDVEVEMPQEFAQGEDQQANQAQETETESESPPAEVESPPAKVDNNTLIALGVKYLELLALENTKNETE